MGGKMPGGAPQGGGMKPPVQPQANSMAAAAPGGIGAAGGPAGAPPAPGGPQGNYAQAFMNARNAAGMGPPSMASKTPGGGPGGMWGAMMGGAGGSGGPAGYGAGMQQGTPEMEQRLARSKQMMAQQRQKKMLGALAPDQRAAGFNPMSAGAQWG